MKIWEGLVNLNKIPVLFLKAHFRNHLDTSTTISKRCQEKYNYFTGCGTFLDLKKMGKCLYKPLAGRE
jgi:hypothetical protein